MRNEIMRCEGCERFFAVSEFVPSKGGGFDVDVLWIPSEKGPQLGLCPRCALNWFRSLSRGNDPVRVARTRARK